jgi:hypothetical protein
VFAVGVQDALRQQEGSALMEPKEQPADRSAGYISTPPFDPEKYRSFLEDTELSHEQQSEYLKVLWSIMTAFVELGFGVDSVQQALPALAPMKDDSHARTATTGTVGREMGSHLLSGVSLQAEK